MAREVLELNALTDERDLAKITWKGEDGETCEEMFELLAPESLGTVELARLSRTMTEHDELYEKEKRTKAEDTRLERLSNQLTQQLIPDAPALAIEQLGAVTKRSLAVRFFVSAGLASKEALGTGLASRLASSLPDSPASTEDPPESG